VFECPDYSNKGTCEIEKCPLPHVQRASPRRLLNGNGARASPLSSKEASADLEDGRVGFFEDTKGDDSYKRKNDSATDADMIDVGAQASSASAFKEQDDFIRL